MYYYAIDNRENPEENNSDLLSQFEQSLVEIPEKANLLMTEQQVENYITDGEFIYKIDDTGIISRLAAEILDSQKAKRKTVIKEKYFVDILWTDDEKIFYEKLKLAEPTNTDYDIWYAAVMVYWNESWSEYSNKKQAILNAQDYQQVCAITFSPTHVKTIDEIKELKP